MRRKRIPYYFPHKFASWHDLEADPIGNDGEEINDEYEDFGKTILTTHVVNVSLNESLNEWRFSNAEISTIKAINLTQLDSLHIAHTYLEPFLVGI